MGPNAALEFLQQERGAMARRVVRERACIFGILGGQEDVWMFQEGHRTK